MKPSTTTSANLIGVLYQHPAESIVSVEPNSEHDTVLRIQPPKRGPVAFDYIYALYPEIKCIGIEERK